MTARADPVKLARVVALSWLLLLARRGAASAQGMAEAVVTDSNNRPHAGGVVRSFLIADQARLGLRGACYDTLFGSGNDSLGPFVNG